MTQPDTDYDAGFSKIPDVSDKCLLEYDDMLSQVAEKDQHLLADGDPRKFDYNAKHDSGESQIPYQGGQAGRASQEFTQPTQDYNNGPVAHSAPAAAAPAASASGSGAAAAAAAASAASPLKPIRSMTAEERAERYLAPFRAVRAFTEDQFGEFKESVLNCIRLSSRTPFNSPEKKKKAVSFGANPAPAPVVLLSFDASVDNHD